jgi:hypothetical protein
MRHRKSKTRLVFGIEHMDGSCGHHSSRSSIINSGHRVKFRFALESIVKSISPHNESDLSEHFKSSPLFSYPNDVISASNRKQFLARGERTGKRSFVYIMEAVKSSESDHEWSKIHKTARRGLSKCLTLPRAYPDPKLLAHRRKRCSIADVLRVNEESPGLLTSSAIKWRNIFLIYFSLGS